MNLEAKTNCKAKEKCDSLALKKRQAKIIHIDKKFQKTKEDVSRAVPDDGKYCPLLTNTFICFAPEKANL
jgi:hypothetical protein